MLEIAGNSSGNAKLKYQSMVIVFLNTVNDINLMKKHLLQTPVLLKY